jgi:hypothetical protein
MAWLSDVSQLAESFSACVQRDVRDVPTLLDRQDRVRRHGAIVQQPFELGKLLFDEAPQAGSDVDVVTAQFESHM